MSAVKQKDGKWKIKKKDGTLGKRSFSTQANALAAQRGAPKGKGKRKGKGKSTAVAKTKGRSRSKSVAVSNPAKPPKIGSAYTAGKASVMLLAPVTDAVIAGMGQGKSREDIVRLAGDRVLSIPYAYNLAVMAVDAGIDRKTAQATALTMGSGTAILPELYLASLAYDEVQKAGGASKEAARQLHRRIVIAHQGYDPVSNAIVATDHEFRTYRTLKHVGQVIRVARGKSGIVRRILAPLTRFAKALGGRV